MDDNGNRTPSVTISAWPVVTLGELFDADDLSMQNGFPCGKHSGESNGIAHLRPMNVSDSCAIDLQRVVFVDFGRATDAYLLRRNDVIFNNTNSEELVGKTALWNLDQRGYTLSNHMTRLRAESDRVSPDFLAYCLFWLWRRGVFRAVCRRHVNQASVSKQRLRPVGLPLPPLGEQRAIAAVLGKIQAAVAAQQTIIDRTAELKAALMAKLFTEGTRGEPLKKTEIGPLPDSWKLKRLGEVIGPPQYGLSVRGEAAGEYPILRMNCQHRGRVTFGELQFVDLDDATFNAYRLFPGDILFNRTNSIDLVGRTAIYESDRAAVFASYLIRIQPERSELLPAFLNHYFNWGNTQQRLKALATRGVSQSNISAGKLRGFDVPLPNRDEQAEIVGVLDKLDERMAQAHQQRTIAGELFTAMLDELMTGRIRVNDLDLAEALEGP